MFKVKVIKDGKVKNMASFETMDDANGWIAMQENKSKPWSLKKDRWLSEDQFTDEVKEDSTDQRFRESDPSVTEYFFQKEYSIEIEDLSLDPSYIARQKKENVRRLLSTSGYSDHEMIKIMWLALAENDRAKLNDARQNIKDILDQED
jgi:hypothetical protein